jgi:uncharacterized protein (TIGR03067 family)
VKDNHKTGVAGEEVIVKNVQIEIDPTSTPRKLTETITTPAGQSVTILGIYKFEGDTLFTCVALAGQSRPTQFVGGPRAGSTLQVFKRIEAASKAKSAGG